ncbi:MAG TPA: BTAD domain-containing putative transcriptional regulator [Chloroflexia bacterium]|nr:BTAD domain-containing putative transcriptional regulator [Chloroflexia bacterium]
MATTALHFLGPPRFWREEHPIDLPPAKAVGLLAYLAVTHTAQSRETIMALLWPESFEDAARKNLRNTLWAIRKALGEGVLLVEDDRLAIGAGTAVDVWAFEELAGSPGAAAESGGNGAQAAAITRQQVAVATYGGALLDGLTFGDAPELDLWLAAERERLEQLYLRSLAELVDLQRREGDWAAVLATARRALGHDNLQEPMHRAVMEAHARVGERPEALRQYDTLRATLDRELGVEPLPETDALRAAILAGALQPIAPRPVDGRPFARPPILGDTPPVPFIGRTAERAALDAEKAAALRGQARVVLLTGEVGIGKSRLWHEWVISLPPEVPVLESRCLESTQSLPFAPLTGLFHSRTCAGRLFGPGSPVSPIWLAEIARLLPELRVARPDLPAPAVLPPEEERRRVFEAFTQTLAVLQGQPLILFLDDLHWADRATLDWIDYLVHRLRETPLLLVGAYRPEEAPAALVQVIAGWGREGIVRRLPLARLAPEEMAALLAALGGDPAFATQVQTQSAGNPYFLIELAHAAPGDMPPALAELVRARLERLPPTAQQVVQAAAVLEPDLDFLTLRRTSGRGEEETLDALDALLNTAVLVERGGTYEFAHPLVGEVVRDSLGAARRAFLHRRAAEALEITHAGQLAPLAGRLAAHYAAAGEAGRAAPYAEMAAARALALAAPDEAIGFYQQALALDPTPAHQMGLGQALLIQQSDFAGARAAFAAALDGFAAQGDRAGAIRACLAMADLYLPAGQPDEVNRWVERGLTYLDATADPAAHAHAHYLLGASRLEAGRPTAEAETHLLEAARIAAESRLPEMAGRSQFLLGNLLAQRGDLAGAIAAFRDSLALAQQTGDQFQEVLAHNNIAYHALLAGDLATAREHAATGLALAQARALRVPLQYLYSTEGEIALAEEHWTAAEEWFRRGLAEVERTGNRIQAASYQANLALAAQGRGDLDGALMLLTGAHDAVARLTAPYLQTAIDLWLVELYRARGERLAAQDALRRAEARLTSGDYGRLQAWAARLRHGG